MCEVPKVFSPTLNEEFVNKFFDKEVKESLMDYIRIENVTKSYYDGRSPQEWFKGYGLILHAAHHISDWVKSQDIAGASVNIMSDPRRGITPLIVTEIEANGLGDNKQDTLFFYGHLDKQPPMEGWTQGGPYTPKFVTQDGINKLYGRGGADDGYSTYATMAAIKSLQNQKIPHPRLIMITEADEESGTGHVQYWFEQLSSRFGNPKLIFCLDSGTLDYKRFWLTNSLRGYLVVSLKVKVATQSVHSGSGTGIIPTCHRIIRLLLDRIESVATGQMPTLDIEKIPPNREAQIDSLVNTLGKDAIRQYPTIPGLKRPFEDIKKSIVLNTWRATLQTLAIEGYPELKNSSNVVIPQAQVKFSIRLPPTLPHQHAEELIVKLLTQNPPYDAEITKISANSDNGFNAPQISNELQGIFQDASQTYFTESHLQMGEGGSIPFMNVLKKQWPDAKFVVTGVLGPHSNAHGPNEFLNFDYVKKLTSCIAHIIAKSSPLLFKQSKPEHKEPHFKPLRPEHHCKHPQKFLQRPFDTKVCHVHPKAKFHL